MELYRQSITKITVLNCPNRTKLNDYNNSDCGLYGSSPPCSPCDWADFQRTNVLVCAFVYTHIVMVWHPIQSVIWAKKPWSAVNSGQAHYFRKCIVSVPTGCWVCWVTEIYLRWIHSYVTMLAYLTHIYTDNHAHRPYILIIL